MSQIVALNSQEQNYEDYKESFILRSLARELGCTATQSVIAYVCVTTGTPKSEFLSNFETFSKLIKILILVEHQNQNFCLILKLSQN